MSIIRNASFMALPLVLVACGGEEQGAPIESTPEQGVTLSLKDASLAYLPSAERHEVNLSPYVTTSDNRPFKLTRVEALSSDAACQVVGQTDTQFYVAGDTKKACDYRYFAESVNGKSVFSKSLSNTSNSALVRLATTETSNDAQLPPLTHATLKNTPVSVDLHAQFDAIGLDVSGWVLSETVTLPYNHGAQVDVDVANQTLTYTPESDFIGIDRILFSFTDENQNPRLGQVDIAISFEANQGLIVEEGITYPDIIPYGKKTTLDISPYVESVDEDDYQLVYLQSYHAAVTPFAPVDLNNKKFDITSSTPGVNIVNFAVSDHKGAYAVGSMKIEVEGDTPWDDIFYSKTKFLAPLTTDRADKEGIQYTQGQSDSEHPSQPEMALMTSQESEAYCTLKDADIATLEQWKGMVDVIDIKGDHNWPVQSSFVVESNGEYYQATSGGIAEPLGGGVAKPMCVQSSHLVVVRNESDLTAVANGVDIAKVGVRVTFDGEYVENELVSASISTGSSAQLESENVTTDDKGLAVFGLTNLASEALTLTMEYGGKKAEAEVRFVGDIETAVLGLNTTVNNQPYSSVNEVTAQLTDALGNPIPGYNVSFSALNNQNVEVQSNGNTDVDGKQLAKVSWVGATPGSDTTVTIAAELNHGTPLIEVTSVTFRHFEQPTIGICGGRIDDKGKQNATGECLKVRQIIDVSDNNKTKWFTSTPSIAMISSLGYHVDNSKTNAGQSYADTYKETGSYGPSGGEFVLFRQDGDRTAGGTQHERYCQNLADIGFAGRNDWQRPTSSELESLHDESGNMWAGFGWPAACRYWSDTPNGGVYYYVRLSNGYVSSNYPSRAFSGSCVSNP
ncbi:DUF1566 domain-containing protein [Vibrio alginolyticus]|uniref:Lcl domain-containing protein n=1 Tax=Vibrio alginolyticus TaxID=663 RepID=UPI00215BF498|nr:DUF1566 domain-containing protein [Vibrio alginolyticus]MCR9570954.1 DUF1566 domain-containing protein [Vibrio alginolyticus]